MKIQGYMGEVHHPSFILVPGLFILVKVENPARGGWSLFSGRRRWWFPPPSPRGCIWAIPTWMHLSHWMMFIRSNLSLAFVWLILYMHVAHLTWDHGTSAPLSRVMRPCHLMKSSKGAGFLLFCYFCFNFFQFLLFSKIHKYFIWSHKNMRPVPKFFLKNLVSYFDF